MIVPTTHLQRSATRVYSEGGGVGVGVCGVPAFGGGDGFTLKYFSITLRKSGAATLEPSPPFSTITTHAIWGSSYGANPANHACGSRLPGTWAVPVLPAVLTGSLSNTNAAVPSLDMVTPFIASRTIWSVPALTGRSPRFWGGTACSVPFTKS